MYPILAGLGLGRHGARSVTWGRYAQDIVRYCCPGKYTRGKVQRRPGSYHVICKV
jgi:hypothetical protein